MVAVLILFTTVRRPAIPCFRSPRTTAHRSEVRAILIQIIAPLPNVTVYLKQAPWVGLILIYWHSCASPVLSSLSTLRP